MKSENLKKMKESGIRVPPFETLRFGSLLRSREPLERQIGKLKEGREEDLSVWSRSLQKILEEQFCCCAPSLPEGERFAVRSSCNLEDGEAYSFPGIFESFLDVTREELPSRILACLRSLYSVKALEYIKLKGDEPGSLTMDVIVQEMVAGEVSGVFFTANPRGILNESVITAGRGRGDLIVSGEAETTSYFYHQTDRTWCFQGDGDLLSFELLEELIGAGEAVKTCLSMDYADIEFAAAGGMLHILQARPVTGLSPEAPVVLDNSNIVESYPGISLPLTESFARMVYRGVFRGAARRVLRDEKKTGEMEEIFAHMVDSVNGRMYYRIDNWYGILRFLPASGRIIPVWQEMMGVRSRQYTGKEKKRPWYSQAKTAFYFLRELIAAPRSMEELDRLFIRVSRRFEERIRGRLSPKELKQLFFEIRDSLFSVWDVTLINDMYAFLFTGLLKRQLKKRDPDRYEERAVQFISGIAHIESMKPVRALEKLVLLKAAEGDSPAYRKAAAEYIRSYGDRTMEELKLETETFRTDPALLEETVDGYLRDEEKMRRLAEAPGSEAPPPKETGLAGFFAGRAMTGIRNRELSRLNRCRVFGMVRTLFLLMAESFRETGCIAEERDIFYLRTEEIFGLAETPEDMRHLVEKRKAEYREYALLSGCSRLVLTGEEAKRSYRRLSERKREPSGDFWQGTGCSGGTVRGEAVLVRGPEDAARAGGKIIVARMTDPGWVFVLAGARGIITEKGSLLSHTAILSRELGIPAVVGIDRVTEILRDGDFVEMDGNGGTVRRQRKASS